MLEEKRDIPCPKCGGFTYSAEERVIQFAPLDCDLCDGFGAVSHQTMMSYNSQELDKRVREQYGRKP